MKIRCPICKHYDCSHSWAEMVKHGDGLIFAAFERTKYTKWAADLSDDQLTAVLWLVGEFALRTSTQELVEYVNEAKYPAEHRKRRALQLLVEAVRRPMSVDAVRQEMRQAVAEPPAQSAVPEKPLAGWTATQFEKSFGGNDPMKIKGTVACNGGRWRWNLLFAGSAVSSSYFDISYATPALAAAGLYKFLQTILGEKQDNAHDRETKEDAPEDDHR